MTGGNMFNHKSWLKNYLLEKPWLRSYYSSRQRCFDNRHKSFYRYGGRGIRFCLSKEEIKYLWFKYKAYLMSEPSLDRIDNNGNYELNNCRYIERKENAKRNLGTKIIGYNGKKVFKFDKIKLAANVLGICEQSISQCCRGVRKSCGGYTWKYDKGEN